MNPGDRIGVYEIVAPLGAGGMGEVYRGRDTRLNRDVAIKVLPAALRDDSQYMARFEREAQTLASLNHPNIATVYGIEQGALVMELVEGPTLADRIARGPVPLDEALPLARQIAEGLEAAHERGIVHRDLKPANIKITPEGAVKLLDFGLAKTVEPIATGVSNSISPTLSLAMTQAGYILGTAGYMSPEQARGKPVDKRADIWAYGVVLYEMLTGRTLFGGGETVSDALAAVLTREPDWDALPADAPRTLLRRCLTKDPRLRLRDIGEARILLDAPPTPVAAPAPAAKRGWLPWAVAAAGVAIAAVSALRPAPPAASTTGLMRFRIDTPPVEPFAPAVPNAVPSPDGRYLAVLGRERGAQTSSLWLRSMETGELRKLEGAEGGLTPFWSPDSRSIAYICSRGLCRLAVAGGRPETILTGLSLSSGDWSSQGEILLGRFSGVTRVSASGENPALIVKTDRAQGEVALHSPKFLPGGRFLYLVRNQDRSRDAVYAQEFGKPARTLVVKTSLPAAFVPPDILVYAREGTIRAQRLDMKTLKPAGAAVTLAEGVTHNQGTGRVSFAVSEAGILTYRTGATVPDRALTWYDRSGKALGDVGEPGAWVGMALSHDARRVAVAIQEANGNNVDDWFVDIATGVRTRMTTGLSYAAMMVWSPDGARLAINHNSNKVSVLDAVSGRLQPVPAAEGLEVTDWAPDGKSLIATAGSKVVSVPLEPGQPARTLVDAPGREYRQVRISPDGRLAAYFSGESGRNEVYLTTYPGLLDKRAVSRAGGIRPLWRGDGREFYFLQPDGMLTAAPVSATGEPGVPVPLFATQPSGVGYSYAAAADGKRFLVSRLPSDAVDTGKTYVLLNWMEKLK